MITAQQDRLGFTCWYAPAPTRIAIYYWLFILIIFSAPWFVARFHSAFSLTDVFIVLSSLYIITNRKDLLGFMTNARPMLRIGSIFVAATIYSLIVPFCMVGWDLSFWRAVVTASQYGCIFFLFPILASGLCASFSIKMFTRVVALAYIAPLLVQMCYVFFGSWIPFSDYFFTAGRALLSYGNANSAATVISISLPFFVTLISEEEGSCWRAVGLLGVASSSSCLLLTGSTSGFALFICTLGCLFVAIGLRKSKSRSLVWITLISLLVVGSAIGTALLITNTRPESDQLRYRFDLVRDLSELVYKQVEHAWVSPPGSVTTPKSAATPKVAIPDAASADPASPIVGSDSSESKSVANSDPRIPSASLRLQFMRESLESVSQHLYGLYGEGIGQAQALRGERITHLVYLLLLEEGGWPLLFSYLALFACLYRNLWLSDGSIEYRLCLAIALSALAVGGFFQTHMYARFYWIPVLYAFAIPCRKRRNLENLAPHFPRTIAAVPN